MLATRALNCDPPPSAEIWSGAAESSRDRLFSHLDRTELGWMQMAASARGICWLALGDEPDALEQALLAEFPAAQIKIAQIEQSQVRPSQTEARLGQAFEKMQAFLQSPGPLPDLPLVMDGTPFQKKVWAALQHIPAGSTRSYGEIARCIGHPRAARAVATACAINRIAVLIPCHRVIAANGDLAGYRWGLARKAELLQRESGEQATIPAHVPSQAGRF